jgi:signal transduction histidine kinase
MTGARILVVEDERIVALHLRQQLVKLGYIVDGPVASGKQALQKIEEARPELVLLDIHIEGDLDGIATAAQIPAGYYLPVIYLTAYSEPATLDRAAETRPYGYLIKPFSERELHATIQMALERCRAERVERRSEAALRQAQKMEAIGQLTGGLAHDFNNLIGIILGNLDLLAERYGLQTEERTLIDPAIQAAERGAELTRQLLAFSRRQPLAPKLTRLLPVLETTAQLLRRTLGEAITLELRVSDPLWPVLIDVSQLESALLNLSVNARDAMPNGGRLTVEASNIVIDERLVELNLEVVPGDYVLIAVSDTGCGMTAEVLAHVFEPFFTTKGNGGTGLGLSMVHGFLRQSGGHTRIYSETGHGTTVRLYLPRGQEGLVPEAETPRPEPLPRGHETILVVEDNKGIRDLALRYLQSLGYRTIPAVDGASALEIIKGGTPIDLLFTDVVMPGGMDGRALADAARRQRPGLRILFTSGFTAAAAAAVTESQFGANLLSKPYRKGELARRVRALLDAPEG